MVFVPKYQRSRTPKDTTDFARNLEGNPASAQDREFTYGIARRIETMAELAGISILELEQEAGLSKGSIHSVLSGRRAGATTMRLCMRVVYGFYELGVDVDGWWLQTGHFKSRGQPFQFIGRALPISPREPGIASASSSESSKTSTVSRERPPQQLAMTWLEPEPRETTVRRRRQKRPMTARQLAMLDAGSPQKRRAKARTPGEAGEPEPKAPPRKPAKKRPKTAKSAPEKSGPD